MFLGIERVSYSKFYVKLHVFGNRTPLDALHLHSVLCFILIFGPLLALFQYDIHGIFCFLWRVFVFLEQSLYQPAHIGALGFPAIPVNRTVSSEHIGQIPSQPPELGLLGRAHPLWGCEVALLLVEVEEVGAAVGALFVGFIGGDAGHVGFAAGAHSLKHHLRACSIFAEGEVAVDT